MNNFNRMIYIHDQAILTSDWHITHQNIYWFLSEARQLLSACQNPQQLSREEWIKAEQNTYLKLYNQIQVAVQQNSIQEFYFLGDLVFGLTQRKKFADKMDLLQNELAIFY